MKGQKVRISCTQTSNQKLSLIKLIKDYSGMGLKESKDLIDRIHDNIGMSMEFELREGKNSNDLIDELKNINGKFLVNGGIQWQRNKKMLDLGIGAEEDYSEFISEYITYNTQHITATDSIEFLRKIFSKLDKPQLEVIFKNLNIHDSNL